MVAAEIATERLILRPLSLRDCALIQAAARRREVADTMISIPHPFSARDAERYVRTRLGQMRRGRGVALCIWTRTERAFCGFVELRAIDHEHALAELSFWLAVDAWGLGYMSEAIGAVLRLSFQDLGLNRIHAYHMVRNPASAECLPATVSAWRACCGSGFASGGCSRTSFCRPSSERTGVMGTASSADRKTEGQLFARPRSDNSAQADGGSSR